MVDHFNNFEAQAKLGKSANTDWRTKEALMYAMGVIRE